MHFGKFLYSSPTSLVFTVFGVGESRYALEAPTEQGRHHRQYSLSGYGSAHVDIPLRMFWL